MIPDLNDVFSFYNLQLYAIVFSTKPQIFYKNESSFNFTIRTPQALQRIASKLRFKQFCNTIFGFLRLVFLFTPEFILKNKFSVLALLKKKMHGFIKNHSITKRFLCLQSKSIIKDLGSYLKNKYTCDFV